MSGQTEDIVGLVDAVVRPLIEFEDDLEIQASETEDGGPGGPDRNSVWKERSSP